MLMWVSNPIFRSVSVVAWAFFLFATTTSCTCRRTSVIFECCRFWASAGTGWSTCRSPWERAASRRYDSRRIRTSHFWNSSRTSMMIPERRFLYATCFHSKDITRPAWVCSSYPVSVCFRNCRWIQSSRIPFFKRIYLLSIWERNNLNRLAH